MGASLRKVSLADNRPLLDVEYDLCCRICDIVAALADHAPEAESGGIFWDEIGASVSHRRVLAKDRHLIDHSFLLDTRFRDFPTIAYELPEVTPQPDCWVSRYVRLCAVLDRRWQVKLPARFGELGWNVDGFPVNRHTALLQERLACMAMLGVLAWLDGRPRPTLIEIGAGAGELGFVFRRALPHCTWIDCDLPESLVHAAIHLAVLTPEVRHLIYVGSLPMPAGIDKTLLLRSPAEVVAAKGASIYVPHFLLDELRGALQVDFAFNAWSFSEMSVTTVNGYAQALGEMLGAGGIAVEQNGDLRFKGGVDTESILGQRLQMIGQASRHLRRPPRGGDMRVWAAPVRRTWPWRPRQSAPMIDIVRKDIAAELDQDDAGNAEFPVTCWDALIPLGLR